MPRKVIILVMFVVAISLLVAAPLCFWALQPTKLTCYISPFANRGVERFIEIVKTDHLPQVGIGGISTERAKKWQIAVSGFDKVESGQHFVFSVKVTPITESASEQYVGRAKFEVDAAGNQGKIGFIGAIRITFVDRVEGNEIPKDGIYTVINEPGITVDRWREWFGDHIQSPSAP
jgi:hypothetical protein